MHAFLLMILVLSLNFPGVGHAGSDPLSQFPTDVPGYYGLLRTSLGQFLGNIRHSVWALEEHGYELGSASAVMIKGGGGAGRDGLQTFMGVRHLSKQGQIVSLGGPIGKTTRFGSTYSRIAADADKLYDVTLSAPAGVPECFRGELDPIAAYSNAHLIRTLISSLEGQTYVRGGIRWSPYYPVAIDGMPTSARLYNSRGHFVDLVSLALKRDEPLIHFTPVLARVTYVNGETCVELLPSEYYTELVFNVDHIESGE